MNNKIWTNDYGWTEERTELAGGNCDMHVYLINMTSRIKDY